MSELTQILSTGGEPDPTWTRAQELVQQHIDLPTTVGQLVRSGWSEKATPTDLVRLIGGAKINVGCLLQAAEYYGDGRKPDAAYIIRAVDKLGVKFSSVVITVNLIVRLLLRSKPPPLWRGLTREFMSSIEVGMKFGERVPAIGSPAGALMGAARYFGLSVLLIHDKKAFKEWRLAEKTHGKVGRKKELELFGCEPYQVAALTLQRLGFGVQIAAGAALAIGDINPQHLSLAPELLSWKAAIEWIDALRLGRDMPRNPDVRSFFPELAPPKGSNQRNPILGVLYTEIAKVKTEGSQLTWHLPVPDYDVTATEWGLE